MLKKKNLYVAGITILVVFLTAACSCAGLVIYFQWRQLEYTVNYYEAFERLDTLSDIKNVTVDSLNIRAGFEGVPVIEGRIINKGKRPIVSATVRLVLLDSAQKPVYESIIYPIEPFRPPKFFKRVPLPHLIFLKENTVQPNATMMFRCTLWNLPKEFSTLLRSNSFSDNPGAWNGSLDAEVLRIRFKPEDEKKNRRRQEFI